MSPLGADPLSSLGADLGGYSDLGIRMTDVSVDAIHLTMQQVHQVLWEVVA